MYTSQVIRETKLELPRTGKARVGTKGVLDCRLQGHTNKECLPS